MDQERPLGRRAPWLRAWLVVGLAGWTLLGVLLVNRANNLGLVDDISFSPYHLVGYAALGVLAVYVAWAFFRALRHGRWREAFPPQYGGLGLGFVLLVAWVVLDPVWRDTLGINESIERGLAPTRLLIPVALALLAAGPVREAVALRRKPGLQPDERAIRWAGVVATGLVGAAVTLAALNPIQTPVQDWSYRPAVDNSEVWTMDAGGSNQTRLLAAQGDGIDYSLPAWSPDGSRIAFTTWTNKDGAPQNIKLTDQLASVWTMTADGTDRKPLVTPADADAWIPAWSPDGAWLTYTLTPHVTGGDTQAKPEANPAPGQVGPPSGAAAGSSIWAVRPDGTGSEQLTPEGVDALGATWSPDGTRLAHIVASAGGNSDIHVATVMERLAGAAPVFSDDRALAADPANDWGPAWSPDGTRIAFVSDRSGNDEIWVAGVDGGDATQLTDSPAGDWVPAFSPDGVRILFVSERTGEPEIWSMATDGSDPRNLTNHPGHFDGTWSIAVSADGKRVAFGTAAFQDPVTSGWVREDLGVAQALLFALVLAVLALVLVALGAPFGSFALVLTIVVVASATPVDQWRFVPAALVAGLVVDGLVMAVRLRWRGRVAAAAFAGLGNLALALAVGSAGTLAWTMTLVLGVALASALIGWGLAEAVERLLQRPSPVAPAPIAAPESPAR